MSSQDTHEPPPLSAQANTITPGVYRHFKGGLYDVIGVGRHSESLTEEFVVYRSKQHGYLMVRPVAMFLDHVERGGYSGPRFVKVTPPA